MINIYINHLVVEQFYRLKTSSYLVGSMIIPVASQAIVALGLAFNSYIHSLLEFSQKLNSPLIAGWEELRQKHSSDALFHIHPLSKCQFSMQ